MINQSEKSPVCLKNVHVHMDRRLLLLLCAFAIYWDLCKAYMNIPLKIITIVLTLLLVGNMRRIVQYNEMNR